MKAVEVIHDKSGRRMMIFLQHIVSFADRGGGLTEIHCSHRGVFKIKMPYDRFVDMFTTEKKLTYFTTEDYDEEDTAP